MSQTELLAELLRELAELTTVAERLSGRLKALETIIERFGDDES